jgi:2-succinyl-5-enolpyruvyl-6-hydroxy-3-cyclohexene-1-carboxylate synthase
MSHPTDALDAGTANLMFARALVDELCAAGVTTAVVCPGSRSTPLTLAFAGQPGLAHSVHIDERSAAFFALGHAKATGRPVALLCTSGTAGANFAPAVAEACHARVPLVVLTADRPPELRAWGAAQTMEQRMLYAGFTRWSEEAPCPSEGDGNATYARALARRAVCEATGPAPGPVHLNLPFREPLVPATIPGSPLTARTAAASIELPDHEGQDASGALARDLHGVARGVLLFGPDTCDASRAGAAHRLAATLGWPVLADPASGLRAGATLDDCLVHAADLLLRDADTAEALQPELILRFGGQPTSKAIAGWMERHASADVWLVDPAAGFRDPQHRATRMFRRTARQFAALASSAGAGPSRAAQAWRDRWLSADRATRAAVAGALDAEPRFFTPHLARELWAHLPDGATLYAANSMAVREIDAFTGPRAPTLHLLANRGVNGIDGLVSSALGASAALRAPTVLWCGDLALLHDVSGLVAGLLQAADLTVVVSNDDGGGIFEYLPVARQVPRDTFERLFAVPHGLDLSVLARGLGWDAVRAGSVDAFADALSRALRGGRHLIEVPIDRVANTAFHASLQNGVLARLHAEPSA